MRCIFFIFCLLSVVTQAVMTTSTNQINCVYEDTALSERERTLIREDLSRSMARDLEEEGWYEPYPIGAINNTNNTFRLRNRYACNRPDEIYNELDKVIPGTNGVACVFISQKCSNFYKQKIALIDQYPTVYPSLCMLVEFLSKPSNIETLTDEQELNYLLPALNSDGSQLNNVEGILKTDFTQEMVYYPPSFGWITAIPLVEHPDNTTEFLGHRFSLTPNPKTHLPNFVAVFYRKHPDSDQILSPIPVFFMTNCWKVLYY